MPGYTDMSESLFLYIYIVKERFVCFSFKDYVIGDSEELC